MALPQCRRWRSCREARAWIPAGPKPPLRPRRHRAEVVPIDGAYPEDESPEGVPGAILRTILDTEHWLAAGTDGEIGDLDSLVLSGIVWGGEPLRIFCKRSILY